MCVCAQELGGAQTRAISVYDRLAVCEYADEHGAKCPCYYY